MVEQFISKQLAHQFWHATNRLKVVSLTRQSWQMNEDLEELSCFQQRVSSCSWMSDGFLSCWSPEEVGTLFTRILYTANFGMCEFQEYLAIGGGCYVLVTGGWYISMIYFTQYFFRHEIHKKLGPFEMAYSVLHTDNCAVEDANKKRQKGKIENRVAPIFTLQAKHVSRRNLKYSKHI